MERNYEHPSLSSKWFEVDCILWGESLCLACMGETGTDVGAESSALRLRAAEQWASLKAREMAEAKAGASAALSYLAAAFALGETEYQCLILSLLPRMDRRFEGYYEALEPDGGGALTPGLAMWLLEERGDVRACLREEGTLMRLCFEGREEGRGLSRPLHPARRIESLALFEDWDRPGCPGLELVQTVWQEFPGKIHRLAGQMADYLARTPGEATTFLLIGQRGAGRRTLAAALAARLESPLLLADGRKLFSAGGEEFRLELLRECVLQRCPVCIIGLDEPPEEEELCTLLAETARYGGCSMVVSEGDWAAAEHSEDWRLMKVELPLPTMEESRDLWAQLLAQYPHTGADSELLAGKYRFTPGQIRNALDSGWAAATWRGLSVMDSACLEEGCRSQLRHSLGDKARKVERLFTWDDLILPASSKLLLRSACDQIKYRRQVYEDWGFEGKLPYGKGLSMLFSGPPGTGKTMAAQIAAGELGLELYKVELPTVVSKYVGETEKNLNHIFREAARSQAILFFDEADVLFGKRTEVKDAHDKYNNMEAAFLLQKMEEYSGVSVLATNFLQNFDEAFKRRIRFIIEFPFPNAEYRKLLWQSVFPAKTPLEGDVDWEFLAQNFELSGSSIKNVAVNAAFLAAGQGKTVGMTHLLIALRRELHKSGKVVTREDFGQYYMLAEQEWDNVGL